MMVFSPALFGLLGALAVNALPRPAAAPQGSQSVDPTTPWSYTCKSDGSGYTDQLGNDFPCSDGTVCKDGADGSPCAWPDDATAVIGAVADGAPTSAVAPPVSAPSLSGSATAPAGATTTGGQVSSANSVPAGSASSVLAAVGATGASASAAVGNASSTGVLAGQSTAASVPSGSAASSGSSAISNPSGSSSSVSAGAANPTAPPAAARAASGAISGSGEMATKTAGTGQVVYEKPDTSTVDSDEAPEGGTRLVAYYDK
ncbi:hypothetical protein I317_04532 [Kwoniella heveanensis CBS 569]|nr:hypothetical protein I317_04532 [Kwoniella heveanensis CBS 569]